MKANRGEKELFVVTFLDKPDSNVSPGATVQIYQNGSLKQTIYNIESSVMQKFARTHTSTIWLTAKVKKP